MLISFVIPAYNAADTIVRCLDSIYALPLNPNDCEVIVIDDCSTDNTVKVIEQYGTQCCQPANFHILKQPTNNRQGAARNRGLKIAKGQYICFVDSDDTIAEGVIDALKLAEKHQLDMTAMHFAYIDEHNNTTPKQTLSFAPNEIFSGIDLQIKHPYWCSGPVGYLYNANFLKRVHYPFREGVLFEDSDFVVAHLYNAERIAYSNICAYFVHHNPTSTTHTTNYKSISDYLLLGTRMLALYEHVKGKNKTFEQAVIEGGVYNVQKSVNRLWKLSTQDVIQFYSRIDTLCHRTDILRYTHPKTSWRNIDRCVLLHKNTTICLHAILSPLLRTAYRLRNLIQH